MAPRPPSDRPYELIYGVHPLRELLRAKRRTVYALCIAQQTPEAWPSIAPLVPEWVQIKRLDRDQLTRLAGTPDHQGLVAQVAPFPFRKKIFDPAKSPLVVLLDGVQDTRNLGAIIRSAFVVGVAGLVICKKRGAPLNGSAIKASAGLAEHMDIYEGASPSAAARELRAAGYHLYVAALGGADIRKITFTAPACIVIGSEGTGVSAEVAALGTRVMLPQRQPDISYNASVAAGIMLFAVAEQLNLI